MYALYFFLINLYKILPFITNIIIQKNCVNETCSIRQKKRKEKKKSYIWRDTCEIYLSRREMRKVRRDVFTSDENSGRRSVRRQIYRRLKWRGEEGGSRKNRLATETLSTTLSKLCQQGHAANSWPLFPYSRDDDCVYRHDNGGRLRATGANDRSGNYLPSFSPQPFRSTICLHREIKESSLARFSLIYSWLEFPVSLPSMAEKVI